VIYYFHMAIERLEGGMASDLNIMMIDGFGTFDRIEERLLCRRVSVMSNLMGSLRLMSRSLKVTRILLVAAFAAGLSACSGGSGPSVAEAPTASAPVSSPAAPSASPSDTASAELETSVPESPSPSASPSASSSVRFRGTDAEMLGQVKLLGADSITVNPKKGDSQEALLTPYTVVLDVKGAICSEGELPHKCSVKQMRSALTSGNALYAKVTIKDGVATQIEEIVGE
jgi:hypothetical protein